MLTGGVDANALQRPKRFFGAARNLEEGGSLTILGTALIETGSRMDEVIYEEFRAPATPKSTSSVAAEKRVYPAINLNKSGTRREELLIAPDLLQKVWVLRKFIHDMDEVQSMEFILDKMRVTKTNAEFFDMMKKKPVPGGARRQPRRSRLSATAARRARCPPRLVVLPIAQSIVARRPCAAPASHARPARATTHPRLEPTRGSLPIPRRSFLPASRPTLVARRQPSMSYLDKIASGRETADPAFREECSKNPPGTSLVSGHRTRRHVRRDPTTETSS